eukprot:7381088-Prymnesium_polylepis.1
MNRGVAAIEDEIEANGTDEDRECLNYVLYQRAGSSPKIFPNSPHRRDHVRSLENFFDFVAAPEAQIAQLSAPHTLALRLYTTAVFKSINEPLRDENRKEPHPLPCTVAFLNEAIKRLRAVQADSPKGYESVSLWRGMKGLRPTDTFFTEGGSELSPMSTTSDLKTAIKYSLSTTPLLFKITTTTFMERGASLEWCSAFQEEAEVVFPPLTYLKVLRSEEVQMKDVAFKIVEIAPTFAS